MDMDPMDLMDPMDQMDFTFDGRIDRLLKSNETLGLAQSCL